MLAAVNSFCIQTGFAGDVNKSGANRRFTRFFEGIEREWRPGQFENILQRKHERGAAKGFNERAA